MLPIAGIDLCLCKEGSSDVITFDFLLKAADLDFQFLTKLGTLREWGTHVDV